MSRPPRHISDRELAFRIYGIAALSISAFFLAMSVHPEIRQFTAASAAEAAEQSHRTAGALFTRLLTESCSTEVVAAYKQGGSQALEAAFQTLGQLAMKELMSDTGVAASMGAIEKHVDQAKLTRVLQGN